MIVLRSNHGEDDHVLVVLSRIRGAVALEVTDFREGTYAEIPLTREEIQALRQFFDEEGL